MNCLANYFGLTENFWKPFKLSNYKIEDIEGGKKITMEVPGFSKDNLKVEVKENQVVVSGNKSSKTHQSYTNSSLYHSFYIEGAKNVNYFVDKEILTVEVLYGL